MNEKKKIENAHATYEDVYGKNMGPISFLQFL
jgi:hypothetical protein